MKALIAAGGTGGHINPGIAIANMLKEKGHEIIFVGTERGLETDLVPKAGYDIKLIHAAGLKRRFTLENVKVLLAMKKGIDECKKIIDEEKPDIVIGTGGYVTAPLMSAAIKKKIPTMIHESNALPGKTTKLFANKVDCVAVGFEEATKRLTNSKNVVCTGNPTRMKADCDKKAIKEKLGITKPLLLVFGGSQGAQKLNEVMVELINKNMFEDYEVIYATGQKHYDEIMSKITITPENVKVEKYIYNMEEVMNASDLVLCRSGALTVSELSVIGVASILIPFPHAAENHQYYNAKTLENIEAGIIIEEKDLTTEILINKINELMSQKEKLKTMGENAKKIGKPDAIKKVEEEINKILEN
ncbi:MAG: undecaprenyldiphospho-muramoylpentapeptide beta-N-acetylglucosaminyltransferase [Clostridia bacterium]|nr:undecaprenyldiphospho-muramoylpentapeptide beta-N-acetylglucosaminyltransferase [Clostridia bacterium]